MTFKRVLQPFIITCTAALVGILTVSSANAQVVQVEAQYWQGLKAGERALQAKKRDFRVVTEIEKFDDRFNATINFPVATDPVGAIATLHDIQTGEPLQNCVTPCDLNIDAVREYVVTFFLFGHQPIMLPIHNDDLWFAPNTQSMGIDYLKNFKEGQKCYREFLSKSPKVDSEATPCYRAPPLMPDAAETSGHCAVTYDVNKLGRAVNITATSCSNDLFRKPSEWNVALWSFNPKVDRGEVVTQTGLETKISFRLLDETGTLIPEP